MTALPILSRELRVAARRRATYWSRFQTALAGVIPTAFLMFGAFPAAAPAQLGAQVFYLLAGLAFLFALLGAVRLPSDSLSAEKREGTLGFLFLTDLKPFDVVMGKLAASSLAVCYGLLALLPLVAIPMLCGGVTLGDFFRLVLALLNALFFALSLAMLVSALCWQSRTAAGVTFLLLFAFGGALPIALVATFAIGGTRLTPMCMAFPCPLFTFLLVPDAQYLSAPAAFWISAALTHGLGWFFLWLCCRALPRVWQDRPAEKRRLQWREWYRRLVLGAPARRVSFRRAALDRNPIFWLGSREIRVSWYPWIFLGSVGAIGAASCWGLQVRGIEWEALLTVGFILHLFFKHWLATLACHAFSTDRDQGALELLLSTSVSVADMIRGQALTLRRIFLKPIVCVLLVELAGWGLALRGTRPPNEGALGSLFFLSSVIVFVADLVALSWVGWWMGATCKNAGQATANAYFRIFFIPVGAAMSAVLLLSFLLFLGLGHNEVSPAVALAFYVLCSLAADWGFAREARRKLLHELRNAAAERYGSAEQYPVSAWMRFVWAWWRGGSRVR